MTSLGILWSSSLNLKNKIRKIEHKEMFCDPSKILKTFHDPHKSPPALPIYLYGTLFCKAKVNGCFWKTMFIWIQLTNFPKSNLMKSIIFAHRIGNAYTVKILTFIRSSHPHNLIKKETLGQVFSCEFCEISKSTFSFRTPPVTASILRQSSFLFS